ncbi:glycoside hydrolase family 48 protein [Streptomyces stelliscabiei]
MPSTLQWSGAPDTWSASSPGANAGLHVTVAGLHRRRGCGGRVRQDADVLRRSFR